MVVEPTTHETLVVSETLCVVGQDEAAKLCVEDTDTNVIFNVDTVSDITTARGELDCRTVANVDLFHVVGSGNNPEVTIGSGSASLATVIFSTSATGQQIIQFGGVNEGEIRYNHNTGLMQFTVENDEKLRFSTTESIDYQSKVIDVTSPEALLVRKDTDGGDVFVVNSSTDTTTVYGDLDVVTPGSVPLLVTTATGNNPTTTLGSGSASSATFEFSTAVTGSQTIKFGTTGEIKYNQNTDQIEIRVENNEKLRLGVDELTAYQPLLLDQVSAPSPTTDRLYNVSGDLFFNGHAITAPSVLSTASNQTLDQTDDIVRTTGALTITLPLAATYPGKVYTVYNTAAHTTTINTAGSDIFDDGSASLTITTLREHVRLFSDGVSAWLVI
jgi:hypothetical protein